MKKLLEVKPPPKPVPAADAALTAIARTQTSRAIPSESDIARRNFLTVEKRPLFLADWMDALFIHFEIDPHNLQPAIPFALDLFEGKAHVSLVAFTMRRLRPAFGGRLAALPFLPFGNTRFLNVRAYVRNQGQAGIYFMTEFISSRLSVPLGPLAYGLPYHFAKLDYECGPDRFRFKGSVARRRGDLRTLEFNARLGSANRPNPSPSDRLNRFLTEKYNAYTCHRRTRRKFSVWHDPWPLASADVSFTDTSLLDQTGDWSRRARLVGAMYSPGVTDVWMSRPHRLVREPAAPPAPKHRHAAFLELP